MAKGAKLIEVPFPLNEKEHSIRGQLKILSKITRLKIKLWEDTNFVLVDVPLNPEETKKILPLFSFVYKNLWSSVSS